MMFCLQTFTQQNLTMPQNYRITLLPGDGIGTEIMAVAVDVLKVIGKRFDISFEFSTALIGGAAIFHSFNWWRCY
ncbi:MAG: 3-isopropylmalate dehydrogenase [Cyanobacteriota bacterium]